MEISPGSRLQAAPGPWVACAVVTMVCGCALVGGGGGEPDRLEDDVPGPFEERGALRLCMDGTRLDSPGGPGVEGESLLGLCVSGSAEPRECAVDGECGPRERCVCGTCRVPVCRTNSDCPEGTECAGPGRRCQAGCLVDGDCAAGEVCDPSTLGCTSPCEADGECSHGEVCSVTRGTCSTVACLGSGCSADRTCDVQRRTVRLAQPALHPEAEDVMWVTIEGEGVVRFVVDGSGGWRAVPDAPVLEPPLTHGAVATVGDGGLMMVLGVEDGSALHVRTSPDGIAWSEPAWEPGGELLHPGGGWDRGWIGNPGAVPLDEGWLVAYEGGPFVGIGLVIVGQDGTVQHVGDQPTIDAGSAGADPWWTDVDGVGSPALLLQPCGGGFRGVALLFEGRGLEWIGVDPGGGDPPVVNCSIGYARFTESWVPELDPRNPVFSTEAGIAVTRSEHGPAIACGPGGFTLVYTASNVETGLVEGLFRALSF